MLCKLMSRCLLPKNTASLHLACDHPPPFTSSWVVVIALLCSTEANGSQVTSAEAAEVAALRAQLATANEEMQRLHEIEGVPLSEFDRDHLQLQKIVRPSLTYSLLLRNEISTLTNTPSAFGFTGYGCCTAEDGMPSHTRSSKISS